MNFQLFALDNEIESNEVKITSRKLKIQEKGKVKSFLKKEKADEVFNEIPGENESIHIVSNGSFDYFSLIPIAVEMLGGNCEFYFSTWTMNEGNVAELFKMYDAGSLKSINALVGLYFKKREANVFNHLYEGCKSRGQNVFSNENHSKVTLISNGVDFITISGSANFTANPRIEQFSVFNSKELYQFHKEWMDEIFKTDGRRK